MCTAVRSPSRRWSWRAARARAAGSARLRASRCASGLSGSTGCEAEFVLEGTTGWRFVVEEIERAGHVVRLADPAETAARRGRKRRAKTDDSDCELMLRLLLAGELPESWIPPVADPRAAHTCAAAQDVDRSAHGLAAAAAGAAVSPGRAARPEAAHRDRTAGACAASSYRRRDARPSSSTCACSTRSTVSWRRSTASLRSFARRQPGCRALTGQLYGVGAVTATAILAELGDARRFRSSDDAVRHSGLDVTVWQSDRKRAAGHLSHQGPSAVALGVVRGRPVRRPPLLTRPRLLPRGRQADRPQPRLPLRRAQTLPTRPPPPARTRRRRTRPNRPASTAKLVDAAA